MPSDFVEIKHHCAEAVTLRDRYACSLMRGAGTTSWALIAGTMLLLAVVVFAPRHHITAGVAASEAPVAVALTVR